MIDKKWIGHELPASILPVERSRLQFFAKAVGETRAEYIDVSAARAAGYADLPAPPTFLMAAELDHPGWYCRATWTAEIPVPSGSPMSRSSTSGEGSDEAADSRCIASANVAHVQSTCMSEVEPINS